MASATPDLRLASQSLPRDWYQIILLGNRGTVARVCNLPKVVTCQRHGRELNSRPLESQANALTITPPGHKQALLDRPHYYFLLMVSSNRFISILHCFRDMTTFTVNVTVWECDLEK